MVNMSVRRSSFSLKLRIRHCTKNEGILMENISSCAVTYLHFYFKPFIVFRITFLLMPRKSNTLNSLIPVQWTSFIIILAVTFHLFPLDRFSLQENFLDQKSESLHMFNYLSETKALENCQNEKNRASHCVKYTVFADIYLSL